MASSCIRHSFGVNDEALHSEPTLNLYDIMTTFKADTEEDAIEPTCIERKMVTAEMRQQAENHKNLGNDHLAAKRDEEAVAEYTKAIELDPENYIYYSNRAAAFTMMKDYTSAVQDCLAAISLKPDYAKAFGRLGYEPSSASEMF